VELAQRLGSSYSYWRDMLAGIRSFGEKAARRIEQGLGLPNRWLDEPHDRNEPRPDIGPPTVRENTPPYGQPRIVRRVPVLGTAKLGEDGCYEYLANPAGQGGGWVEGYTSDPQAYALRVKGDSMHPAIRHGALAVVAPGRRCTLGEYVAIELRDGRKMLKELVFERTDEVVVESVNGHQRRTIEKSDIEHMHPVTAVVSASMWCPE
jgi:phage repressor protein C with HTH and peptisase S24 domain